MEKILLDTNFLLLPFEYGVDVASELLRIVQGPFSLVVPSGSLLELKTLAGRNGKHASDARAALQYLDRLAQRFSVEVPESSGRVDEWIIKYAQINSVCVATNDVPLRLRLRALGVRVVVVKGKSKLDFI